MPIGPSSGTEAASQLQARIAGATRSLSTTARATQAPANLSGGGNPPLEKAAIAQISDAGRAALAAARPQAPRTTPGGQLIREMTTGTDVEYRTYKPGDAHFGKASNRTYGPGQAHFGNAASRTDGTGGGQSGGSSNAVATESDKFATTTPGHKSIGELTLRTAAHEAAHVVQQQVRVATSDLDGDGRADVAVAGPPSGDIQETMRARHDTVMNAIRNIKA